MQVLKPLLLAAATAFAVHAHAGFVYSATAVPIGTYSAPSFTNGVNASVQSTSVVAQYLQPQGTTGTFLVVSSLGSSTQGTATINTYDKSSYSFVWGSPDTFNVVDIYGKNNEFAEYNGSLLATLTGHPSNGDNGNTVLFTIAGTGGTTIDHVVLKSSGVAFEVAAVPEPGTYALMLAGLGALAFVSRRRNRI